MIKKLTLSIAICFSAMAYSQISETVLSQISFRNIGPGFMTGRIADIEKDPNDPSTWYVAVASGNVWKTTNNGTTFKPIFENYGSFSTGYITIDPNDSNTIWLGTGENQSQRSVGWGDGVYKSTDAGKSWKNVGLKNSEHIGKIIVDPKDGSTVYVAAQGPLWKEGGDRGLYKTLDGGKTWERLLHISENTGITDVFIDPTNSDVIYALSYQRRRHVGILIGGGPETGLHKSIDGGKTWKKLTRGLPGGNWGRPGMTMSPQKSNVLYLQIPGKDRSGGGFYRSEDSGETWTKKSDYSVVDPQYYGELYADPNRFDHVYAMDVSIHYTTDGGSNFKRLNGRNVHGDYHEMLFDKSDPNYMMVAGDGGIYESWDYGNKWSYHSNLPITQFYRVGIDNAKPFYNVYGGTQDNATIYAPVKNTTRHGITNADWKIVIGGDGFQARVDPDDPNIVYGQYQYAGIVRHDKRTGERIDIQPQPQPTDDALRWHWDSPLVLSPHNSKRLYYAAQRIFKSDDRGDSWTPISGDLSRGESRNDRKVMGKVWPPEAVYKNVFTSPYGTIVALSESTISEGLIVAGTDDGLIQITENGGNTWSKVDIIKGVPRKAYVADVLTSNHDRNTIYAVFNNHKDGDFKPYFVKSTDMGKTWKLISSGFASNHTGWSIVEDHKNKNLLFAATEFGLYASVNGGTKWTQMKGGLPTIAFRDLEIHKEENDLVAASFGRGFYVLDDYAPLREAANAKGDYLFAIKDALQFFRRGDKGYSRKGSFGDNLYSADNPQYGAKIRVYLNTTYPSAKSIRKKNENANSAYPTAEALQKEDFEERGKAFVRITNSQNEAVAMLPIGNRKGFQEVFWNLSTRIESDDHKYSETLNFVPEGAYTAQLITLNKGQLNELGAPQTFNVKNLNVSTEKPASDRFDFYKKAAELSIEADRFSDAISSMLKSIKKEQTAFIKTGNKTALAELEDKRQKLLELEYKLSGNSTKRKRFQYYLPGAQNRISRVLGAHWETSQVTKTQRDNLAIAAKELEAIKQSVQKLK